MSGLDLNAIDLEHLSDLRRKGTIALGPDGVGVPTSIAIRLQMAGLGQISRTHPQTITVTRAGAGSRPRSY